MYESIENGCTEQQYQTFASESEQWCKKKTRRRKQNQQVKRFFNLFEEISQEMLYLKEECIEPMLCCISRRRYHLML